VWRFGMAHVAPYLARLPAAERGRLRELAVTALGDDPPPLQRSIIIISAIV
jgi:hypothetical protein